jgi:hypothetical protein
VIAFPVIILVGVLGSLIFGTVRNANDNAALAAAYQQQLQQQQAVEHKPAPQP